MLNTEKMPDLDLSVVIPAMDEGPNLDLLLPLLRSALNDLGLRWEILVVDAASDDGTPDIVASHGARYLSERAKGYGNAILTGAQEARGAYIITMDADHSHPTKFIRDLWAARDKGDLVIASRYVKGGGANQPFFRLLLSKILNAFFRIGLALPARDLSSGYRLYNRRIFDGIEVRFTTFVFLVELLLIVMRQGREIAEIPFHYEPRDKGQSHARIIAFGVDYCRLFHQMWRIRNSCTFPDYDWRADKSRIPIQRWWRGRRIRHLLRFAELNFPLINVGCGSSRIMQRLPAGTIGVDIDLPKLRFMKRTGWPRLQADGCHLPFPDASVATVIGSQVIEYIPGGGGRMLDEFARVVRPGGCLVLGTPDHGNPEWRITKWLYDRIVPDAYGQKAVTRYTFASLKADLEQRGFDVEDHAYIGRGELIVKARKR